jgi:hydroxyacylglutathione hydrolase
MQVSVFTSGIWQTTTTVLRGPAGCVVVDPAYFPRELDAIAAHAAELGGAAAVVFTHGHWDHVMGHAALPDATVWMSETLARDIASGAPRAARYLENARAFDSRWYVPRPAGHRWPAKLRGLPDHTTVELAGLAVRTLHVPGHSPDGVALATGGVVMVGDYLSPCEIPFVDDAQAYRSTLVALIELVADAHEVIPGHGPRLSRAEALVIARADLDYLDRLRAARTPQEAAAIELPRAADVEGMRDHHRENCAVVMERGGDGS